MVATKKIRIEKAKPATPIITTIRLAYLDMISAVKSS